MQTTLGTPEIETDSPSEDWGIELSKTIPLPREESLLPDVPTPVHDSPFWIDSSPNSTQTPTMPVPSSLVESTYSRNSTPDSRHGPSVYFSKKLRQKVLISRGKKRNCGSSFSMKPSNAQFSPQIQRIIAAEVQGVA